jgi:hypothetical protein
MEYRQLGNTGHRVSAQALLYPFWHQARNAADRLGLADLSLLGPHLRRQPGLA